AAFGSSPGDAPLLDSSSWRNGEAAGVCFRRAMTRRLCTLLSVAIVSLSSTACDDDPSSTAEAGAPAEPDGGSEPEAVPCSILLGGEVEKTLACRAVALVYEARTDKFSFTIEGEDAERPKVLVLYS